MTQSTSSQPAKTPQTASFGIYDRPRLGGVSSVEIIAIALSVFWLLGSAIFFLALGGSSVFAEENSGQLTFMMTILAVLLPVAIIWVAASAARSHRLIKEESERLQAAVDALRQTYVADAQRGTLKPSVEQKLEEIASTAKQTETAVASFASQRLENERAPALQAEHIDDSQPSLELGTQAEDMRPALAREDFIRALHFPETPDDQIGFAALRRALADRRASAVVRASQDVLTLLSQEGIYMDDLRPDRVKPELWRRFADGERGRQIAALGGIHDRSSLALTAGRLRKDTVFRDTSHHFMRKFDEALVTFCHDATDAEIDAMSQTRTARAFVLIGRVMGIFG